MKIQNLPRANEIAADLFEIDLIFQQHKKEELYIDTQLYHTEKGICTNKVKSAEYAEIMEKLKTDTTEFYFTTLMQFERKLKDELETL